MKVSAEFLVQLISLSFLIVSATLYSIYKFHGISALIPVYIGVIGNWILLVLVKDVGYSAAQFLTLDKKTKHVTSYKFGEQAAFLCQRLPMILMCQNLISNNNWFKDINGLYKDIKLGLKSSAYYHFRNGIEPKYLESIFEIEKLYLFYYMFIGYGIMNIGVLLIYERQDPQFALYFVHHIIELILLSLSWFSGVLAIGVQVFYVHQLTDLTLELVKVFHYLNYDWDHMKFPIVEIGFALNLLVWGYYRLYLYPTHIILPTFSHESYGIFFKDPIHRFLCYCLIGLMSSLIFFHIYWYYKLLRLGYQLASGKGADVKEE